jgi:AP-2 complex subunit mu-1
MHRYRCTENVNLPFRVLAVIKEHGRTRVEANVKVKANFNVKLFALNVVIRIPLPPNTAVAKVTVAAGKAKFEPENQALVWRYGWHRPMASRPKPRGARVAPLSSRPNSAAPV